jgi:hypothetical protein
MKGIGVEAARESWAPLLADLDVDIVLQGHDHVLSRGFVDREGNNAQVNQDIGYRKVGDRTYTASKPSNAPLYYVGSSASNSKFYPADDEFSAHAASRYRFLDLNSAREAGHAQNPDGPQTSNRDKLPTYTSVSVTEEAITFQTYMFRYSSGKDAIETAPFLFDSFTVIRSLQHISVP